MPAARCDDAEAGCPRPVDKIADQRRLIAEGQAVHDAGFSRLVREQRAAQRVGLDGDIDHVFALAESLEAVFDGRDRVARAFDDDVDFRMTHQRLPVVADVRRAPGERGVERWRGAAFG